MPSNATLVTASIQSSPSAATYARFEQRGWEWGTEPPAPTGDLASTFGEIVYRYYADEACTQPFVPGKYTEPGTHYVRPEVDATANWSAVAGEPKSFTVAGTYKPVPGETTETAFGYTRKLHIVGKPYEVVVFTNTDEATTFTVPSGVRSIEYLAVAGGGSGGTFSSTGVGGSGVGGSGGAQGTDGAACTGSGGGGSSKSGNPAGKGGSGIVVLRYPAPGGLVIMIK